MSGKISYKIQSLHLYPIKSARGVDVERIEVLEDGPQLDRQWMIVDSEGLFQTQRATPEMARIETFLRPDALEVRIEGESFRLPYSNPDATTRLVKVWKSEVLADEVGNILLNEALSELMGKVVTLVHFGPSAERSVIKSQIDFKARFRFADSASFLVVNAASLTDLNSRLKEPVPMNRFRPNIVIEGAPAWAEDHWKSLACGTVKLDFALACGRCQVITQDQLTGIPRSRDPLLTLSQFRRKGNSIEFGMHAVQRSLGPLKVGDSVQLFGE